MVFLWTSPLISTPLIWQRLPVLTRVHENCLHFTASLAVGQGSVISCHQWAVRERCRLWAQAVRSSWLTRQAFSSQVINGEANGSGYCSTRWESLHQPWVMLTLSHHILGESVAPRPAPSPQRTLCDLRKNFWWCQFKKIRDLFCYCGTIESLLTTVHSISKITSACFFIFKPFLNVDSKSLKVLYFYIF